MSPADSYHAAAPGRRHSAARVLGRVLLALVLWAAGAATLAAQTGARVSFGGSIKDVDATAQPVALGQMRRPTVARMALRPEENAAPMEFAVALQMRNFAELQARTRRGERIAPAEMEQKYFPAQADY